VKILINDINITYSDQGQGTPIFLMHGNPDSRHCWNEITKKLGNNVRIIAPDFPGFGDSEALPEDADITPKGMLNFWSNFIDALKITEPMVVAVHDFGGPWLLPWVAENPDRVRGLLLMNTLFQQTYHWHFLARIWQTPKLGELSMKLLNHFAVRRELRRGPAPLPDHIIKATYDRIHPTLRKTTLRFYRAYAKPQIIFAGWQQKIEQLTQQIPTRIIWGDGDPYIPKRFADGYAVDAIHLKDHGHWVFITEPDLVVKALLDLADQTPADITL